MKRCGTCGAFYNDSAQICLKCGLTLPSSQEDTTSEINNINLLYSQQSDMQILATPNILKIFVYHPFFKLVDLKKYFNIDSGRYKVLGLSFIVEIQSINNISNKGQLYILSNDEQGSSLQRSLFSGSHGAIIFHSFDLTKISLFKNQLYRLLSYVQDKNYNFFPVAIVGLPFINRDTITQQEKYSFLNTIGKIIRVSDNSLTNITIKFFDQSSRKKIDYNELYDYFFHNIALKE